jgi:Rad3-related DNA helicase
MKNKLRPYKSKRYFRLTNGLAISAEECLTVFSRPSPKPYQTSSIRELVDELSKGKDAVLCLPTGTGKTFVYLPVAITAASNGFRVCVLVATNLIMEQIKLKYMPSLKPKIDPDYVKGIENYECELTKGKADYGTCTKEQRIECSNKGSKCEVLLTNELLDKSNFVITNFHKFLSVPTTKAFDLVIIDDSHGFENALEDKFQTRVSYHEVDQIFRKHEEKSDLLSDFSGAFLDFFDDAWSTIPPEQLVRRMPDDVIKNLAEIKSYDKLRSELRNLDKLDRSLCYNLMYFVDCCRNASLNTFYLQKDWYNRDDRLEAYLISRKSETYQDRVIKNLFRKAKVAFISATPGEVITHAKYCTHRNYTQNSLAIVPHQQPLAIRNWFEGLTIFETNDISGDAQDSIEKGAQIAAGILKKSPTKGRALLLFKNYRDQRKAEVLLKKNVDRDITFIDDGFQTETVQELVEKADVIMATASSRLWEGIDISNLKLEIVFSLPFIRPPVYLDQNKSFSYGKRKMLVRLQQGIGRLIRKEKDRGVCVIMDNRLEKYKTSSNFSELYRERVVSVNSSDICKKVEKTLLVK